MGETLRKRLLMARSRGLAHEAVLNLLVAAGHLRERLDGLCAEHDITNGQYNVLRILRGQPEGYARCDIARRMIERAPDVTRLIDRLEARGFVARDRSTEDRRRSVTRITPAGLELLAQMQAAMENIDRSIDSRLSEAEMTELSRLLEKIYASDD